MRRTFLLGLGLLIVAASLAAGAPDSQPALRAISYHRTGGFAGTDDRIDISSQGLARCKGKLIGAGEGQLSREQMAALVKRFEGWDKLSDKYPPAPGSADGFEISISYGGKTVTANDTSPGVPQSFHDAREELEKIARSLGK